MFINLKTVKIFGKDWLKFHPYDKSEQLTDPFWENIPDINHIIDCIYNLFESEFENAPINEKLHDFIFQFDDNKVLTIRKKLEFISQQSFLYRVYFNKRFAEMCESYKRNGAVVLTEESNISLYDQRINYNSIFADDLKRETIEKQKLEPEVSIQY
jgi:hypothetical protein